jgi:hypothetical protein
MKLLLAVLLPSVFYAEVGQSYLAMCHPKWPCKASISVSKTPLVTGWLENTFAKDCPCADRLLRSRKSKIVRVHLLNGPCLRNQRCGRYEAFYGMSIAKADRLVAKRDERLLARISAIMERASVRLSKAKNLVKCYVSACLECDLRHEQRRFLAEMAASYFPQCVIVDNPVRGRCLPGYICEKHGPDPKLKAPCIADLDGVAAEDIDVKQYLERTRQCELRYLWTHAYNCISGDKFVDPRKRDCKTAEAYFK